MVLLALISVINLTDYRQECERRVECVIIKNLVILIGEYLLFGVDKKEARCASFVLV